MDATPLPPSLGFASAIGQRVALAVFDVKNANAEGIAMYPLPQGERGSLLAVVLRTNHLVQMAFASFAFGRRNADDASLRRKFWRKLRRVFAQIPFAEDLLAAYYCAFDRTTPRRVQLMLIAAIAYFVLPADAIPDWLPVVGFSDDAAVLAATLKLVADHVRDEHRAAAREKLADITAQ